MIQTIKKFCFAVLGVTLICSGIFAGAQTAASTPKPGLLTAAEVAKILPPSVFFQGQSASIQARNSGGVRFSDGALVLAALVDSSGYSTSVQQKYQSYLITEVPLEFDGHQLPPGAYGCGFRANNQFVIMDIGGHDLLTASAKHDEALHRPVPLKVVAGDTAGTYHLYQGREEVTFSRASGSSN
jgi:hypothetical protein